MAMTNIFDQCFPPPRTRYVINTQI
jgi:hypothetical protein